MAELYNFFGDIFDYIRETYLEVDFGSYKNFTVTTQGATLSQIIFGILFGCMLASFAVVYQRSYLGRMVRGLLSREAHDEASALTLADLGLAHSGLIKYTLRSRSTPLRKVVRFVGEEREEEEYNGTRVSRNAKNAPQMTDVIDFENTRFYIPKHLAAHAEVRFDKKGSGARALIVSALACIVAGVVLIRFLPVLLHWADDLITFMS